MSDLNKNDDLEAVESESRRAALRSIGKYATLGAGAGVVVLSSSQAVKANPSSTGCANGNSPICP